MAGTSFKMNLGPLQAKLGAAARHFANTMGLASEIGEALASSTRERFKKAEAPDGTAWPKSARAEAEGGQTLTDTARLKNSIGYEATPLEVAVGTNVEYAAIHQFGGEIKPKAAKALKFEIGGQTVVAKKVTMPARPFIGRSDEDEEEIREVCADWLRRGLTP